MDVVDLSQHLQTVRDRACELLQADPDSELGRRLLAMSLQELLAFLDWMRFMDLSGLGSFLRPRT